MTESQLTRFLKAASQFALDFAAKEEGTVIPPPPPPPPGGQKEIRVPQQMSLADACKAVATDGRIIIDGEVAVTAPAMVGTRPGGGPRAVTIHGHEINGAVIRDAIPAGTPGEALLSIGSDSNTVKFINFIGQFGPRRCIRGYEKSHKLDVAYCTFHDFARHCLDLDGNDWTVNACNIQRILNWQGARLDAHGIVTTRSQGGVIKNCDIGLVSGDCFQGEDGPWSGVLIEDCSFWDAPLEQDLAGFTKGMRCSENGIDTKGTFSQPKAALIVRRTKFDGFGGSGQLINNCAALNLKQDCEVLVEGCSVRNSEIGFRVRGHHDGEKMFATIRNCEISGCKFAVRAEDKLLNFVFESNRLSGCGSYYFKPQSQPWTYEGWHVVGNTIVDAALVGKTFPVSTPDKPVLGVDPLDFPVPPVTWVGGQLVRSTTNKIVGE